MASPSPDLPALSMSSPGSPAAADFPQLRSVSAEEVKAMSDQEYYECVKFMYSDVSPSGIENLLEDPRAQPSPARTVPDPFESIQNDLEASVKKDDITAVSAILRDQRDLKQIAISQAIEYGSAQVVNALVSASEINLYHQGQTYLHKAATHGQLNIVKCLVNDKGANTRLRSPISLLDSRPPVQVAAYYGHKEVFEYLLGQGAQSPWEWQSLLFKMLANTPNPRFPQLQLQPRLNSEIILSLCNESIGHVRGLPDVNLPKEDGRTLLHAAVLDARMIQLLLKCGASPFARDKSGKTPFDASRSLAPSQVNSRYIHTFLRRYRDDAPRMNRWKFPHGEVDSPEKLDFHAFPRGKKCWLSMPENNDAFFTAAIALAGDAQGYNHQATATALQLLSRTFMQHDAADHLLRFRESSYNAFTLASKMGDDGHENISNTQRTSDENSSNDYDSNETKSSEQDSDSDQAEPSYTAHRHSIQADKGNSTDSRVQGISIVIPYFHTALRGPVLDRRVDLEDNRDVRNEPQWNPAPSHRSKQEETKRARHVRRRRNIRALNIHEPRTLDESYYLGFSNKYLFERNNDQVLSGYHETNGLKPRILMVSQLWLWSMGDVVISACGSQSDEQNDDVRSDAYQILDSYQDPQSSLHQEFANNNLQRGDDMTSLQLAALIFSECINYLDQPNYAGLDESIFHVFENAVGTLYDQVKSYMNENNMDKIRIKKEMAFIHRISDIRDELVMIKSVITEQEEVWNQFYKDLKKSDEFRNWNSNNQRVAIRPKDQIPKFKRRIQKIDEDAQRVEQWIQGQLELKKTHASLKESRNSTVLSTAVIGFTIITIFFTPLSFMTSLLAVPDGKFTWGTSQNSGKTWISVVEIISLGVTVILVMLSLWWLKQKRTLSDEQSDSSPPKKPDAEGRAREIPNSEFAKVDTGQKVAGKIQTAKAFFNGLRKREKQSPTDLEQSSPIYEADIYKH